MTRHHTVQWFVEARLTISLFFLLRLATKLRRKIGLGERMAQFEVVQMRYAHGMG